MKYVPSRRVGATLLVTAVAGGSLAAGVANGATTLQLKSKKQGVAFNKKSLKASAGRVTIRLKVAKGSQFPHAIAVKGNGVNKSGKVVTSGTSKVKLNLKRGSYTFYCPVGEHAANGMRGTLKVG
jgi:plastocyanin